MEEEIGGISEIQTKQSSFGLEPSWYESGLKPRFAWLM